MLEAVHLTKVYKTKGGTDVRALDNVSLRFSERGMVYFCWAKAAAANPHF